MRERKYNTKPNSTSFKKGHKKLGGFVKGSKHSETSKGKIRLSLLNKTGEKARHWKGGLTNLRRLLPQLDLYEKWRTTVFKRDKYTCCHCNVKGVYIEADHIVPLKVLIRDYKIKNSEDAIKCKAIWNIDNGRTLCRECHKKTDSYAYKAIKNYAK